MDDFIDDGEANIDVSSAIQSIFGYDKSRYDYFIEFLYKLIKNIFNRYRDEDFDDREMESDYRTVMKEESLSKKIGLMEDLEDMRREAEELKRKEELKKIKLKKRS